MAYEGGTSPSTQTTTGWIEKAIALVDHGDIDNHVVKASAAAELAALRAENERLRLASDDLYALTSENAAQARQIAALREAESIVKAMALYSSRNIGQLTHLMAAAEAYKPVDLPPSSMRLVPLEGLQEIADLFEEEKMRVPDWLAAAIAGKETEPLCKSDRPT